MKKALLCLIILSSCSLAVSAASYKINAGGKVTSPAGTIQQKSSIITEQDIYKNYNATTYVNTKQVQQNPVGTIDIVMDYSGSMAYWISAAKNSMAMIVSQLPSNTKVGFRVFGHDSGINPYTPVIGKIKSIAKDSNGKYKVSAVQHSYLGDVSGSCSATSQIVPVIQYNASSLINGMNSVNIGGATPLTLALQQAVSVDFKNMGITSPKKIILITDGGETCGGDPCAFARQLASMRKDITIDVVLVSSHSRELACLSTATGGKFYNIQDVPTFTRVLSESLQNVESVPETQYEQKYEFIGE